MPKAVRTHLSRTDQAITLRPMAPEPMDGAYSSGAAIKPKGFWYEVDGDWRRWCEAENFGSYSHIHEVDLADCHMLFIDTLEKLDAFDDKYRQAPILPTGLLYEIDWGMVARDFDGLEIAPYRWERRLDFLWYYGWDCASGVIWRPRNATVTYVGEYFRSRQRVRVSCGKSSATGVILVASPCGGALAVQFDPDQVLRIAGGMLFHGIALLRGPERGYSDLMTGVPVTVTEEKSS